MSGRIGGARERCADEGAPLSLLHVVRGVNGR